MRRLPSIKISICFVKRHAVPPKLCHQIFCPEALFRRQWITVKDPKVVPAVRKVKKQKERGLFYRAEEEICLVLILWVEFAWWFLINDYCEQCSFLEMETLLAQEGTKCWRRSADINCVVKRSPFWFLQVPIKVKLGVRGFINNKMKANENVLDFHIT